MQKVSTPGDILRSERRDLSRAIEELKRRGVQMRYDLNRDDKELERLYALNEAIADAIRKLEGTDAPVDFPLLPPVAITAFTGERKP